MLAPLLLTIAVSSAAPWGIFDTTPELDQFVLTDYTRKHIQEYPDIFEKNPELFNLHRDLVTIESISNNEWQVSHYLQRYLKNLDLGLQLYLGEGDDKRNIYAYSGDNANATVLLTSHIDTVPPYIGYEIRTGDNDDVEIHGRGSCDAKASVAAQIIAFKELLESGKISAGDVALLYVIGEEVGGPGMTKMNEELIDANINWEAVVFGEPTESKLAIGHKGIFLAHIEVKGLASHSGYPEIGVDADKILIDIMHELEHYPWPSSMKLNSTTLNIGMMAGGVATNVVSSHAECRVLLRTAVEADQIKSIVDKIVDKYSPRSSGIKYTIQGAKDPVDLDYDIEGFETYIASYATDIPNLTPRGFKRYLYGPGSILVAHGANEFVSASDLLKAVDDYKHLILESLKN